MRASGSAVARLAVAAARAPGQLARLTEAHDARRRLPGHGHLVASRLGFLACLHFCPPIDKCGPNAAIVAPRSQPDNLGAGAAMRMTNSVSTVSSSSCSSAAVDSL